MYQGTEKGRNRGTERREGAGGGDDRFSGVAGRDAAHIPHEVYHMMHLISFVEIMRNPSETSRACAATDWSR